MTFSDLVGLLRALDLVDRGAHGRRPPRGHVPNADGRLGALKQLRLRALAHMVGPFRSERARRTLDAIASAGDDLTRAVTDRVRRSMSRGTERGVVSEGR